jgi:hypothetical protein
MNRLLRLAAVIIWLILSGTTPALLAQTPGPGIEQQLRAQYPITIVGNNGVVVKTGSVLVVQQDGIMALQAPADWPCNSYKQGGHIKQSTLCGINYAQAKPNTRLLQVGEKVYVVALQAKPTEIVFKVQSIPNNDGDAPFKADVSFQFQKGYQDSIKVQEIQGTVGQIFVADTSGAASGSELKESDATTPAAAPSPAAAPLAIPAVFVSTKTPADRLQLNAGNAFSLVEEGQTYHGTFVVSGNAVELNITETGTKTNATINGDKLTDSSGQTWTRREQAAASGSSTGSASPSAQNVIQNQDIIELVKAGFDDATILTTIGNSKCQFDTSTSALIKLKQSKVSAAVIKAMVGAPK